jgi:hypothetical protein
MPDIAPIAASGRFDRKRPRPIPKAVREAISLMVVGKPNDPDCTPHDFVQAAAAVGMTPFVLRRHLERPNVRAFLLAEKRAFTAMVCAANPASLARIRDTAVNTMSRVAAVRALEQLDEEASTRPANPQTPGITIVVRTVSPPPPMVDVTPKLAVIEDDTDD